jgi:glutathione S-transferase
MKLYSGPLSLFTAKVRVALAEKAVPYELVSVPFSRAGAYTPKHPDVVAINPKAQVPVLVDDDLAVYDSTLILEYLEERHPTPALYPREIAARAPLPPARGGGRRDPVPAGVGADQRGVLQAGPAQRDATRVERARAAIAAHFEGLDHLLGGREYLCGEFSVADIGYFLTMTFASSLGAPPAATLEGVGAWAGRVMSRPAITAEVIGMQAAAAQL